MCNSASAMNNSVKSNPSPVSHHMSHTLVTACQRKRFPCGFENIIIPLAVPKFQVFISRNVREAAPCITCALDIGYMAPWKNFSWNCHVLCKSFWPLFDGYRFKSGPALVHINFACQEAGSERYSCFWGTALAMWLRYETLRSRARFSSGWGGGGRRTAPCQMRRNNPPRLDG